MPPINFFDEQYICELPRTDQIFGLCDHGTLAYSDTTNNHAWIAKVINPDHLEVLFTPIDHNIVVYDNGNELSQCDGMLTYNTNTSIIFVELKTSPKEWIQDAINQLKSTISIFKENHSLEAFNIKHAYAVNKKHPNFHYSKKGEMSAFKYETGFHLYIQAEIKIK
ncbi:MAG TPA: hypothetical protein PLM70_09430 [Bacteroidales bacterium]|nr:hypothetical protein [Bacteroidales bacterium]